jgi:hypothetical protein
MGGYLKLNAFPDTSVCRATAAAAMAESWTHSPVPANKPVSVLTSPRTISAAEEFTYNL